LMGFHMRHVGKKLVGVLNLKYTFYNFLVL
jgi:hypothetical protein